MATLSGQCLVAMPGMADERFEKAVIFLCAHSEQGAMGLIVNKPIEDISFVSLLSQLNIEAAPETTGGIPVLAGGPMDSNRGFVLHSPEYTGTATLPVGTQTSLTVTTEILRDIAHGGGPKSFLIMLGYAGWGAGQLEEELKQNAWLPVRATNDLLFDWRLEKKWEFALRSIGIDPLRLSAEQGKA